jgi:hypothetical protein
MFGCMGHINPNPPKKKKITAFFIIKEFDKKRFKNKNKNKINALIV